MKRKPDHADGSSEDIAVAVLGWIAEDEDRLYPFLNASGLDPASLREAARDPGFLGAVLDHVVGNEPVLIACAQALETKPERVVAAWRRLQPPEFDDGM